LAAAAFAEGFGWSFEGESDMEWSQSNAWRRADAITARGDKGSKVEKRSVEVDFLVQHHDMAKPLVFGSCKRNPAKLSGPGLDRDIDAFLKATPEVGRRVPSEVLDHRPRKLLVVPTLDAARRRKLEGAAPPPERLECLEGGGYECMDIADLAEMARTLRAEFLATPLPGFPADPREGKSPESVDHDASADIGEAPGGGQTGAGTSSLDVIGHDAKPHRWTGQSGALNRVPPSNPSNLDRSAPWPLPHPIRPCAVEMALPVPRRVDEAVDHPG